MGIWKAKVLTDHHSVLNMEQRTVYVIDYVYESYIRSHLPEYINSSGPEMEMELELQKASYHILDYDSWGNPHLYMYRTVYFYDLEFSYQYKGEMYTVCTQRASYDVFPKDAVFQLRIRKCNPRMIDSIYLYEPSLWTKLLHKCASSLFRHRKRNADT